MKDIGSRPVRAALDVAARHGLPLETLVRGLDIGLESQTGPARWEDYVELLDRLAEIAGPGVLEEVGEATAAGVPELAALAASAVGPEILARYLFTVGHPLSVPMVQPRLEANGHGKGKRNGNGALHLTLELAPGYRESAAFFQVAAAGLRALGSHFGAGQVEAQVEPHRGRYVIAPLPRADGATPGRGAEAGLFQAVLEEAARDKQRLAQALRELRDAHHELQQAHEALRAAHEELAAEHAALEAEVAARRRVEGSMGQVLETVGCAAFVVRPGGVTHANRAGAMILQREGERLLPQIQQVVATGGEDGFEVTALGVDGHYLVLRRGLEAEMERRLEEAERRWELTRRQREVLRLLVDGQGNKEIGRALGCSVKTVEAHVTALLERADADSRLSVVAAFWADL